jgi:hypothetical protein
MMSSKDSQLVNWSTGQLVNWSISQSVNWLIGQLGHQSPVDKLTNHQLPN